MKAFIPCLFLLITGISFSQKNDSIKPKAIAFAVKASIGGITPNKIAFSDAGWDRLTPGFQVLDSFQVNPTGTDQFAGEPDDSYNVFSFSFLNNPKKQTGKNYRFSTTIHIGQGPEAKASKYWVRDNRTIIDTLSSGQTGTTYFVYGNRRQEIQKQYRIKSWMIGLGERFALRPGKIFQFETGLDVYMLLGKPSVQSATWESYIVEDINGSTYQSSTPQPVLNPSQTTNYAAKMSEGLLVSIPFDISFALSKNNPFFKRIRLGLEANYGMAFQFTKGKTSYTESKSWALNLRYEFYQFRRPFQSKSQK
ncbi:hypothetical protein [Fluviicola sp.]|uniref:hypothetical protein n=1 Tax=Fluviicola sp. TaxID=1917219 RepID=UPI0031D49EEB